MEDFAVGQVEEQKQQLQREIERMAADGKTLEALRLQKMKQVEEDYKRLQINTESLTQEVENLRRLLQVLFARRACACVRVRACANI